MQARSRQSPNPGLACNNAIKTFQAFSDHCNHRCQPTLSVDRLTWCFCSFILLILFSCCCHSLVAFLLSKLLRRNISRSRLRGPGQTRWLPALSSTATSLPNLLFSSTVRLEPSNLLPKILSTESDSYLAVVKSDALSDGPCLVTTVARHLVRRSCPKDPSQPTSTERERSSI